jgi:hypothetical protein
VTLANGFDVHTICGDRGAQPAGVRRSACLAATAVAPASNDPATHTLFGRIGATTVGGVWNIIRSSGAGVAPTLTPTTIPATSIVSVQIYTSVGSAGVSVKIMDLSTGAPAVTLGLTTNIPPGTTLLQPQMVWETTVAAPCVVQTYGIDVKYTVRPI